AHGGAFLNRIKDLLEGFDLVIASVHSGLEMDRGKMMDRFKRAMDHPATRIIGHPTGRLLLRREESDLDMEELIGYAAERGVVIEVNANPWRLDLDWRWGAHAMQAGLLTSINPDAHTTSGIDDIRWGVAMARKGWFTPDRVINSWSLDRFRQWVESPRRGS
ncbi:MAG: DNA polymerase/3'-5' exonuclease PolX, partial [Balneolaceae bacterium]